MSKDILNSVILAGSFLLLFGIAEILHHFLKVKADHTRKIVHVVTGALTLLFPLMLDNHWLVLLLCLSFAFILIVSLKFNFLKSINGIQRKSVGSIAYPAAVYSSYLAYDYFGQQYLYYYLMILILALCDPLAAVVGETWPLGKYKVGLGYKTMIGSFAFFISSFVIVLWLANILNPEFPSAKIMACAFIVALFSTISEAISAKGYDNLTIPAAVLVGLLLTEQLM